MRCDYCGRIVNDDKSLCHDCDAGQSFVEYISPDEDSDSHGAKPSGLGDVDLLNICVKTHQSSTQTRFSERKLDRMTMFLSALVVAIILGATFFLLRESVFHVLTPENISNSLEVERITEPSIPVPLEQTEMPVFSRNKVQLLSGEYIELTMYLDSAIQEDWVWRSSDPDRISVNSAGIATSTDAGAIAEVSVYSVTDPDISASIWVVCLSEEAQLDTERIDQLNYERYPYGAIDFDTIHFEPRSRNNSGVWDSSLLNELEELSAGQVGENHISNYLIRRSRRVNVQNQHIIDFDIFTHSQTDIINKIVAAEYLENDTMTITEYYFTDDGMIHYVRVRVEASPLPGQTQYERAEHLYFDRDVMVRRRVADQNGEIISVVLDETEQNAHFPRERTYLYEELEPEGKILFDQREQRVLNEAYLILNEMSQDLPVYRIVGLIIDSEGVPVADAEVTLVGNQYNGIDLYHTYTNASGQYEIFVFHGQEDYALRIEKDEYTAVFVHKVSFFEQTIDQYQEHVILSRVRSSSTLVSLLVADAIETSDEIVWQDRFDTDTLRISFAQVFIRPGIGNTQGDYIASAMTDGHGIANLRLPVGAYTAEVRAEGYLTLFSSLYVYPNRQTERIFMSPELENEQMRIVLVWQSEPEDLDLHMFTPHSRQQNALEFYLGYDSQRDLAGNRYHLDSRKGFGPEAITINAFENGVYTIYVTDYNACVAGILRTEDLRYSQARVYVYTAGAESYVFHAPISHIGNIWAIFEIRNQEVIPVQRYYIQGDVPQWCSGTKEDE